MLVQLSLPKVALDQGRREGASRPGEALHTATVLVQMSLPKVTVALADTGHWRTLVKHLSNTGQILVKHS